MLNQENTPVESIENTPVVENIETTAPDEHFTPDPFVDAEITVSQSPEKRKPRYRKEMIIVLSIAAFVLINLVLYKTKPTEADFELWVKNEAAQKRQKSNNPVQKGVGIATQIQILATYRYTDHKIIATVKAKANSEKLNFIGIAGCWVLLP